jgi:hypothetical protein
MGNSTPSVQFVGHLYDGEIFELIGGLCDEEQAQEGYRRCAMDRTYDQSRR